MSELSNFDSFQLEEYKNISTSHYESVKQISTFFRYYLLILAAPVFILNIVSGKDGSIAKFLQGHELPIYYDVVFYYFMIVAMIGFFIYLYVINLRLDAVLYARAVNKVRKYFYQNSNLNITEYSQYLQLPIVATQPKYSEKTFFVPLLFVFSIINCGLLFAAFGLKMSNSKYFGHWDLNVGYPITMTKIVVLTVIFFGLHIFGYMHLAQWRMNYYLKSYVIGIDIDGVLNDQTNHFVKWLKKLTGKTIKPEDIIEYPVSLNATLGVTDDDEKIVFNTKEYWETLPVKENAIKRVEELHKRFGYKILFFSYRDWPQYGRNSNEINNAIIDKGYTPLRIKEITTVTSVWLKKAGIDVVINKHFLSSILYKIFNPFKNKKTAVIEMGNPYISDSRFWNHLRKKILNRNRFQGANTKGFRFFIEDHPENAIKLSSLCEIVFMFDEPYNAEGNYNFPKNVIRVKNWNDIYRNMKMLT